MCVSVWLRRNKQNHHKMDEFPVELCKMCSEKTEEARESSSGDFSCVHVFYQIVVSCISTVLRNDCGALPVIAVCCIACEKSMICYICLVSE